MFCRSRFHPEVFDGNNIAALRQQAYNHSLAVQGRLHLYPQIVSLAAGPQL